MPRFGVGIGTAAWVGVLFAAAMAPALSGPRVIVNGKMVRGVPAYMVGGHVMVPVRGVIERIPGTGVQWDAGRKQVWVRRGTTRVKLNVGSGYAHVNGEAVPLDAPVRLRDKRTLMPLRFVGEVLGAEVSYDAQRQIVSITADDSAPRALGYRSAPRQKYAAPGRVAIGGETILSFGSAGPYASVEERAARVTELLNDGLAEAAPDGRFNPAALWMAAANGNPAIMLGKTAVVAVTPEDAREHNTTQQALAEKWAAQIRAALKTVYGSQ